MFDWVLTKLPLSFQYEILNLLFKKLQKLEPMLSRKVKIFQPYRENLKSLKTILKNYVSSILEISGRF